MTDERGRGVGTKYDCRWGLAIGQALVEGIIEGLTATGRLPSPSPRRRAQAYLNTRRTDQRRARRMDGLSSVRSHMSSLILALMAAELIEETEGAGLLNADYGDESND